MSSTINIVSPYIYVVERNYTSLRGESAFRTVKKARIGFEKIEFPTYSLSDVGKIFLLSSLAEKTGDLQKNINSFDFPEGSLPNRFRTVSVSDTDKATASVTQGASTGLYLLEIDKIAGSKIVNSAVLSERDATELSKGIHQFSFTSGGTTYSLSIEVDRSGTEPDTNRDVFAKLARAIASVDSSIETEVVRTKKKVYSTVSDILFKDMVYLSVQTENSGQSSDFTLRDTTGSIIDVLKLDRLATPGTDAQYSINNISATSQSNSVEYDSLRIELLEKTEKRLDVKVEKGFAPLGNRIDGLITDYNSYMSWINTNSLELNSILMDDVGVNLKSLKDDLESIGLKLNNDNTIEITDSFDHILVTDTEKVREVLTGSEGLLHMVSSELDLISSCISKARTKSQYGSRAYGNLDVFA